MTRLPSILAVAIIAVVAGPFSGDAAFGADRKEPPPFADFTFKKIGAPPKDGVGKRITIQIEPQPDPPPAAVAEAEPALAPQTGTQAAFWSAISPELAAANSGRLDAALVALDKAEGIRAPRLDDMRRITQAYGREILRHTVGTRVSPALVAAIISVESAGKVKAVSSAGAQGLMQLMPATAARFGVTDWQEPAQNIKGGVAYLDWLMGEFERDPLMILAGYNAGEGAVRKHGGVPPYAETRAYVPKVLAAWKVAAGLCLTPPELVSDACVFVGG